MEIVQFTKLRYHRIKQTNYLHYFLGVMNIRLYICFKKCQFLCKALLKRWTASVVLTYSTSVPTVSYSAFTVESILCQCTSSIIKTGAGVTRTVTCWRISEYNCKYTSSKVVFKSQLQTNYKTRIMDYFFPPIISPFVNWWLKEMTMEASVYIKELPRS